MSVTGRAVQSASPSGLASIAARDGSSLRGSRGSSASPSELASKAAQFPPPLTDTSSRAVRHPDRLVVVTVIEVQRGDITTIEVDTVVNAANNSLMGGGGPVSTRPGGDHHGGSVACPLGDPHRRPGLERERPDGQAAVLASCYSTSLDLAVEHAARTVALPSISTGVYRYPKERAALAAIGAVQERLRFHAAVIDRVIFVCFRRGRRTALPGAAPLRVGVLTPRLPARSSQTGTNVVRHTRHAGRAGLD